MKYYIINRVNTKERSSCFWFPYATVVMFFKSSRNHILTILNSLLGNFGQIMGKVSQNFEEIVNLSIREKPQWTVLKNDIFLSYQYIDYF